MRRHMSRTRSKTILRRGFSLVEVLLAIFILGIGMIMVASVFPVGANWTRQATEESNAQTIVKNAQSVLQVHYGVTGDMRSAMAPDFFDPTALPAFKPNNANTILTAANGVSPFTLQAFPGFANISPTERAYQFGSAAPFPARNVAACTYFWTALVRLNPAHRGGSAGTNFVQPSSTYTYDVYILVFRKGAPEHSFAALSNEVPNTRSAGQFLLPSVCYAAWSGGTYAANQTPSIQNAVPPIGQVGIGAVSGTVFKQVADPTTNYQSATPRPILSGGELVIVSPQADGTSASASPLVYVYQTTMSF